MFKSAGGERRSAALGIGQDQAEDGGATLGKLWVIRQRRGQRHWFTIDACSQLFDTLSPVSRVASVTALSSSTHCHP